MTHATRSRNGHSNLSALVPAQSHDAAPVHISPDLVYGPSDPVMPHRTRLQQHRDELRLALRRRMAEEGVRQLARFTDTANLEVGLSLDAGQRVRATFASTLGPSGMATLDALQQLYLRGVVQIAADLEHKTAGEIIDFDPDIPDVNALDAFVAWLKDE
jgi:hypothetical protein